MTEMLNKKELVNVLAEQTGATKKASRENLEAVLTAIASVLQEGKSVNLTGFAKFTHTVVPEQEKFVALLGEVRTIPEHGVLRAKMSKSILKK